MLRVWNVTLVIVTFFLTIFGTFMTRSGVVSSVHAFGQDRTLAWLFTGFMLTLLTVSFAFVIYRLPLLRARHELDSWMSREAAFLVNNWILLFSAFFVLFATMFPTLSEALMGERLTVGPPFFNRWMQPIGLLLLLLTGIAPLLAWRKSTLVNLRDSFLWPTAIALVTGGALVAGGVRVWSSGLCFAFCAFVVATIAQEFWRGARVRQGTTGTDLLTALVGLVGRNKRRYGGYIVHLGIVLMFLGFAGGGFKRDVTELVKRGGQLTVGSYALRNDGVTVSEDAAKQMLTGHVAVFRDGRQIETMYPAKWFFHKHEDEEPVSQIAIRRSLAEDLYVVLAAFDLQTQSVSLQVIINPLVNWIWFGFGVLALGTGIALLPERTYAFALERTAAAASGGAAPAATTIAVILAIFLSGASVSAQHVVTGREGPISIPKNALEQQLRDKMGCTCGGCEHEPLTRCTCGTAGQMRAALRELIDQGKTEDEILATFRARYGGQQFLREPIDQGFNRLAWLFPYLVGAGGAMMVGVVALRWSRHHAPPAAEAIPADPDLDQRLDDELRNLD
jgi:cytochrome c-type biogenesis protein CcmF